jgi:hypothetical protein
MISHRKVVPIVVLLLGSLAAAPNSASAGTLLSGYGGPGQGSQAILGLTLLGGPANGGGGAAGGGQAGASGLGAATAAGQGGGATGSAAHRRGTGRHGKGSQPLGAGASGGSRSAYQPYVPTGATRLSSAGSGILGLSGSDLLLVLLALAGLLFAGALTRGLAQGDGTRRHAGS